MKGVKRSVLSQCCAVCVCRRCWRSLAICWRWAVRWKLGNVAGSSWGMERSSTTNLPWVCLAACFLLRFCCLHGKHCTNISKFCAFTSKTGRLRYRLHNSSPGSASVAELLHLMSPLNSCPVYSVKMEMPPTHDQQCCEDIYCYNFGQIKDSRVFICVFSEWRDQETSGSDWAQLILPYSSWRRRTNISGKKTVIHILQDSEMVVQFL